MKNCFCFPIVIILLLVHGLLAQLSGEIQLVESVPVETRLGISETARTQGVWTEMIHSASRTLDMAMFYLSHKPGEALEPVVEAIRQAAERGVRVRLLADARMSRIYPETLNALGQEPNISVRLIDYYNRSGGVMHAKYFVVDSQEVFIGSQNMDWRALRHIHELGARLRSRKLARLVLRVFEVDWQIAGSDSSAPLVKISDMPDSVRFDAEHPLLIHAPDGESLFVYLTASPPATTPSSIPADESELIRLIDSAQQQVEIQLLTYKSLSHHSFYQKLDNALRRAAARGVLIRMIVSNWNTRSPGIESLKSLQVFPNIEIKISSIPEWSGGFIPFARVEHCKYMVVDTQRVWLGTSNWSYSYFHTSRNLALVMSGKWSARLVHRIFRKSWNSPYCQPLDVCKQYIPPGVSGKEKGS